MEQKKLTKKQMAALKELAAAFVRAEDIGITFFIEASEGALFALNDKGMDGIASEVGLVNEYDDDVERVELDWNKTECVFQPTCFHTDFDGELYLIRE